MLLRITYLHLSPTGFNGWQHISLMTTRAPLCPRCILSHRVTFLCKCVCGKQRYHQNTNVNRWKAKQATAHTGLVIVYCGSESRMSVKLHLNVLRLTFKCHSRKTNTHGSTWKGNGGLCWFRLVKTSPFTCISVKDLSQIESVVGNNTSLSGLHCSPWKLIDTEKIRI